MAVTGHHLPFAEGLPDVLFDLLFGWKFHSELLAHFEDPFDHFLIGQAVQGTCQAIHAGRETQEGIAEGRAHQVR